MVNVACGKSSEELRQWKNC